MGKGPHLKNEVGGTGDLPGHRSKVLVPILAGMLGCVGEGLRTAT